LSITEWWFCWTKDPYSRLAWTTTLTSIWMSSSLQGALIGRYIKRRPEYGGSEQGNYPAAMTSNAPSPPVEVSMPPPTSSATPIAHAPATDRPKPIVECMAIDVVERAAGIPYRDAALSPIMLEDMASRWLTSGRTSVSEWHQKISAAQQLRQGILGYKRRAEHVDTGCT